MWLLACRLGTQRPQGWRDMMYFICSILHNLSNLEVFEYQEDRLETRKTGSKPGGQARNPEDSCRRGGRDTGVMASHHNHRAESQIVLKALASLLWGGIQVPQDPCSPSSFWMSRKRSLSRRKRHQVHQSPLSLISFSFAYSDNRSHWSHLSLM